MQEQTFTIDGMHCSGCATRLEKRIATLEGVLNVSVNALRHTMHVSYEETQTDTATLISVVQAAGFDARIPEASTPVTTHDIKTCCTSVQPTSATTSPVAPMPMSISLRLSLFFAGILMYVSMGGMVGLPMPAALMDVHNADIMALIQCALCLPILYVNRRIFISGIRAVRQGSPNMDTLVGLGAGAAMFFGLYALWCIYTAQAQGNMNIVMHWMHNLYFDSAGMILALIGLGKFFEARAKGRASDAIERLTRLSPPWAVCLRDGKEVRIATKDVVKDDVLVVRTGESIAADGYIIEGTAFIDESAITGESLPVEKSIGDKVTGATVSTSGYFHMHVEGVGEETTLARIIHLVDTATASKAPIARLADRISAVFVPIIITIAISSFVLWLFMGQSFEFALSTAISVLVISCPCALGLATPTAIMVGMGMGAEKGILFKSAAAIERMHSINAVVLDKTGTLTLGKAQVTDIVTVLPFLTEQEREQARNSVLMHTASMERLSEHPLGRAIVEEAIARNISLLPQDTFTNFEQQAGMGIVAHKDEEIWQVGNARMLKTKAIYNPLAKQATLLAEQGKTVLYFVKGTVLQGLIAVADTVKESSVQAVQDMHKLHLYVMMLTGDNNVTAKAVQQNTGIKHTIAEVLPTEKEGHIRTLQAEGRVVAMVGDGINDAPALARADVGIAMGAGTDIAMQSADIVLMQNNIQHVVHAFTLSKAVMRTITQNLFWAFAYNVLLIPIAAGILYLPFQIQLNPMLAAASMSLSSLTVVGNALRLRRK